MAPDPNNRGLRPFLEWSAAVCMQTLARGCRMEAEWAEAAADRARVVRRYRPRWRWLRRWLDARRARRCERLAVRKRDEARWFDNHRLEVNP